MTSPASRDASAIVVGSGPNGLAAAITLASAGVAVRVVEANDTIGGGMRTGELTLPGFHHDVCSAIHPMAVASPAFRSWPLARYGLGWIHPRAPFAHPMDDGTAVVFRRSLAETASNLGSDGAAYRALFEPLVAHSDSLVAALLEPLVPPRRIPSLAMLRFGPAALRSASGLARGHFRGERARALFAGIAAHSVVPLTSAGSASFGLVLGFIGHAWGWPFPRGGAGAITRALAAQLTTLGGTIVTGQRVERAADVAGADIVMFDVSPRVLARIAGDRLRGRYHRRLLTFQHGPAAFKLDWALSEPIPWRATECGEAATIHVGGTLDEIALAEHQVAKGTHPERPFVLLAQPSLFDPTRAPGGRHTAWAYCHVPNGSTFDMTARIETQIERFAPGFRDTILARHVTTPADLERGNANYVGGDVVGGANTLAQTLFRPMLRRNPYVIPVDGWYLCSASTPPGGGVHGMCGYHAAHRALRTLGSD